MLIILAFIFFNWYICDMCTKAVAVNVRAMSEKLKTPIIPPKSITNKQDGNKEDTLPTDYSPVIALNRPREIQYMRWGLIPSFAQDPKSVPPMFNARAETLTQLPSFRDLIASQRCLILNTGFYERNTQGDERVEYKISPAQEDFFYKAGLWTTWRNPANGDIIESFTMITCDPKGTAFAQIHDRMPVIMNKAERRLWMNPHATKEQLISLLKPCSDDLYNVTEYGRKWLKDNKRK